MQIMRSVINNYINGNLGDAKTGAVRHSWEQLFKSCRDDFGMVEGEARKVADYLKGKGTFQAACNANVKII